jgi:sodium/potassium-transporting ATPase subunit alpha
MSETPHELSDGPKKGVHDDDVLPPRAVVFPDEREEILEEKLAGGSRPKGVDLKREMTREEKELAAAGYEHIEEGKAKKSQKAGLEHVDIQEHRLPFADLQKAHDTSFDTKDAGKSHGLSSQEAAKRLERDGQNVLTPTKKASALRKV